MVTELMEIGLAPECVHTDPREKRYYLMKRFVRAAVKYAERVQKTTVKIVAFLYETPFNSVVMVNGESTFNDVSDIFCTPEFTNDERREILASGGRLENGHWTDIAGILRENMNLLGNQDKYLREA